MRRNQTFPVVISVVFIVQLSKGFDALELYDTGTVGDVDGRCLSVLIQGDYAEARRLYRVCVEMDPRDGRGWLGLARQMQKMHK